MDNGTEKKDWRSAHGLRRADTDTHTEAEIAIREAMLAVERAGAHPLLTDAVVLLEQAFNKVADYVDSRLDDELLRTRLENTSSTSTPDLTEHADTAKVGDPAGKFGG